MRLLGRVEADHLERDDAVVPGEAGDDGDAAGNGGSVTIRIRHINIDMQRPTLTVTGT